MKDILPQMLSCAPVPLRGSNKTLKAPSYPSYKTTITILDADIKGLRLHRPIKSLTSNYKAKILQKSN